MKKTLIVDKHFLPYPTNETGRPVWFTLWEGDEILLKFYTYLNFRQPDVWHYCDMSRWMGKTITLEIEMPEMTQEEFDSIVLAETFPGYEDIYHHEDRPQFHFTFKRGVLSDPNGLFYYNGVYHFFAQHQPYTNEYGDWQELCNFGWGHAVSTDLVHWTELPDEFIPDEMGPVFSGNSVIDTGNVSGLKQGEDDPILIYYTAAGGKALRTMHLQHTQCLAYSTDGGKTFKKYEGNPIVPNFYPGNRDPKVFYHEKTGKWVMVIFHDADGNKYLVLTGDDLIHFDLVSELDFGERECPNLFEIEVQGENRKQMMFSGVHGLYMAVDFDGKNIIPISPKRSIKQGGIYQAMQLMPLPDGRLLSFYCYGYYRKHSGFTNCLGIPNELSLYHEGDEYILHTWPMREIEQLYACRDQYADISLAEGEEHSVHGYELMDIELKADAGEMLEITVQGVKVRIDGKNNELTVSPAGNGVENATLKTVDGCHLRLLSDRNMLCVYEASNHIVMPLQVEQKSSDKIILNGAGAHIHFMEVRRMNSMWNSNK